jgi:hypothetical protein
MNLGPLIADIASRSDDFLEGVTDRAQARAGIAELLTIECGTLPAAARQQVIAGVMAVLESEDFFGVEFVGDAFRDDEIEADE